jgi:hypothetical protein
MYLNYKKNICKVYTKNTSTASVCSRLIAGIAGSNPAEGMDVRLLCLMCVV